MVVTCTGCWNAQKIVLKCSFEDLSHSVSNLYRVLITKVRYCIEIVNSGGCGLEIRNDEMYVPLLGEGAEFSMNLQGVKCCCSGEHLQLQSLNVHLSGVGKCKLLIRVWMSLTGHNINSFQKVD